MDHAETHGPRFGMGGIIVALVLGLVVGYLVGHRAEGSSTGTGDGSKPQALAADPCAGSVTPHQVDLNEISQPCLDMTLDSTLNESAVWTAPANSRPFVVFKDSTLPTPVVTGNTASWAAPQGPTNRPPAEYSVNIVLTKTPLSNPLGKPTPTPGMYGRIIIKP